MTMNDRKPEPSAEGLSAPYWEATKRGELTIQRCSDCAKPRHYPSVLCPHCYSADHDWIIASGRGKLHSWTVTHHGFHPAFKALLPYTLVTVDIEEGVRVLGLLGDGAAQELKTGMALQARFLARQDGFGELTFDIC
jgi:uncharacterized OB-fold protein